MVNYFNVCPICSLSVFHESNLEPLYKRKKMMEQEEGQLADETLVHEFIRIRALAEAKIKITLEFSHLLPVDEIELGRIYYEDSTEVSGKWRTSPDRSWIDFEWWRERRNQTKRIDVTIRCRDFLCGLMLARRSRKQLCITLRYLEGNPNPHPLTGYVLPIALIIAESFATEYSISQVCISRPAKGLIYSYESRGYALNVADRARIKRNGQPRAKLMSKKLN